ncbi:MAG TPA: Hpt domain-containing protein [Bacteroidota bacterium]
MTQEMLDRTTLDGLRDLVGDDDPDFLNSLFSNYLTEGALAIAELRKLTLAGDAKTFTRVAHTLKGSSLNTGAVRVAEIARTLEMKGKEESLFDVDPIIEELESVFQETEKKVRILLA